MTRCGVLRDESVHCYPHALTVSYGPVCVCEQSNTSLINGFWSWFWIYGLKLQSELRWNLTQQTLPWRTCLARSFEMRTSFSWETIQQQAYVFLVLSAVQRLINTSLSSPNHSWRHAIGSGYTVSIACAVSRKALDGVLADGRARAGLNPFLKKFDPRCGSYCVLSVIQHILPRKYFQENSPEHTT